MSSSSNRVSVKGAATQALKQNERAVRDAMRSAAKTGAQNTLSPGDASAVADSFVNFAQRMGVGADNALSGGTYGFNPVTRNRILLEWAHRGSWLAGMAIDIKADDMTRAGVETLGQIEAKEIEALEERATTIGIWNSINQGIKWGRLYGGALAVHLIDGQDMRTPLNSDRIGKDQYKGLGILDRYMVEPSLNDLVKDFGPDMGKPKYYRVTAGAPILRNEVIHHSRVIRFIGIELPYQQALVENMWSISVLERMWDRMIAFDSATVGAAQLVYKAYIRTYKIKGLRNLVAAGGKPLQGIVSYVEFMRRFQGIEGVTLLDMEDEMEAMQTPTFSGLSDSLVQFGQQLSGATGIPLVRFFGQSPAGLNATGESDMRMYYDNINKDQKKDLQVPITTTWRLLAQSKGIQVPEGFGTNFRPLWQLTEKEKSEIAESDGRSINAAEEAGIISQATAMQEYKQSSRVTGRFTNITNEDIAAAEDTLPPAGAEAAELEQKNAEAQAAASAKGGAGKPGAKRPVADSIQGVRELKGRYDLDTIIENRRGSVRRGPDWESVMPADYGAILGTRAPDGEPVDLFIGRDLAAPDAFIVDQVKVGTKAPDEPKVLVGYLDVKAALADFLASYSDGRGWERVGGLSTIPMTELRAWVMAKYGTAPAREPAAPMATGDAETRGMFRAMADSAQRAWDAITEFARRPQAPSVAINVPPIEIPDINIPAPVINVAAAPSPTVNVTMPTPHVTVAAPQVNVRGFPSSSSETVHRDPVSKEVTRIDRQNKD